MGKILFKEKDLVVPGDILAEEMVYLPSEDWIGRMKI